MAEKYGNSISAASITGYSGSKFQSYIKAEVSYPSDTTAKITLTGNIWFSDFTGGGGSTGKLDGTSITDGNSYSIDSSTGNGWAASGHGAGTKEITVNRTNEEQTLSYSCVQNVMGLGASTATVSVTVAAIPKYALTLSKNDYISSVSGSGSFAAGTDVTVKATLPTDTVQYFYSFDGWYEGSTRKSTNSSYTFSMPGNAYTLTAKGTRTTKRYTASASVQSGEGSATVNNQSSVTVDYGTNVTYRAVAADGWKFVSWSDGNTDATRTVNVTSAVTLSATFVEDRGKVNVKVNGAWKRATAYVKVSGVWKPADVRVKVNGVWKRGK